MNKEFKRVEVKVDVAGYNLSFLITNLGTYNERYLNLNHMVLTDLGEIVWIDVIDFDNAEDIDVEVQQHRFNHNYMIDKKKFNMVRKHIEKNIDYYYDNFDEQFKHKDWIIDTVGILNTYKYNNYL